MVEWCARHNDRAFQQYRMGGDGSQEIVTLHLGQIQFGVDRLPRPHHLARIADAELSHQHPELGHRGRRLQVLDDVRVDLALSQEPLCRATL